MVTALIHVRFITSGTIVYFVVNAILIALLNKSDSVSAILKWLSVVFSAVLLVAALRGSWKLWYWTAGDSKKKFTLFCVFCTMLFCVVGVTIYLFMNGLPNYKSYSLSPGIDNNLDYSAPAFALISLGGLEDAANADIIANNTNHANKCFYTNLLTSTSTNCSEVFPSNFSTYQSQQYGPLNYYLFSPGSGNDYLLNIQNKVILNSFVSCKWLWPMT